MDSNNVQDTAQLDADSKILDNIRSMAGVTYSDEQLAILRHKGGMCILASAGSGKTTLITHLIAKRIQTYEIQNTDTLLCTTYSTGGAEELETRLNNLLKSVGIRKSIRVKTMHAMYLSILVYFGYPSTVIDSRDRTRYILEACRETEVSIDDEEFQTLDSLLSYQINNLLSDAALVQSYAYTLDNISLEQYSEIRKKFNSKKIQAKVIDFDDMQLYMYSLLYQQNRQDIVDYCRAKWTDIYIDEAQDMSRIQYVILKKIVTDPQKLVIIGDDDQCLIEGTKILTENGTKNIEDIDYWEKIKSSTGRDGCDYRTVDNLSKKQIDEEIAVIKTASGKELRGTLNHIGFAKIVPTDKPQQEDEDRCKLNFTMLGSIDKDKYGVSKSELGVNTNNEEYIKVIEKHLKVIDRTSTTKYNYKNGRKTHSDLDEHERVIKQIISECKDKGIYLEVDKLAKIGDEKYNFMNLGNMIVGMIVPVVDDSGNIVQDEIIEVSRERYNGYVYDLSVPDTRNFVANGIIVHNCIYQWRGADPSIILNVCADYDISRFVLSTNYRCAGEIVKLAAKGIKHNSKRSEKEMKPFIDGGDIKVCDCGSSNLYTMSKYAYKHIKKLVIEDGVKPSQIAILSRNNSHLCILSNMLFKDGIHCDSTGNMKLTRSTVYKNIKDILELASDGYNAKLTENTLNKVCVYMKKADSKRIGQIQSSMGTNLSSVLGYMATKYWKRSDISWTPNVKVPGLAEAKIAQPLSYLGNETVENLVLIFKLLTDTDTVKRATGLLVLYLTATEYQYKDKQDKKRTVEGLVDYIMDLIKTMGLAETKQFLKVAEQYEEGKMAVPGAKVCMSTMHGAKGKEWKHVVLFADDNVAFPSFSGIVRQLKTGVAMSDVFYGIDENRRLHYVAMTRAKKELAIFTDSKDIGVFILEAMDIFDYGVGNNSHIVSMATEGIIYPDLIDKSNKVIFGEDSIYNYKIDISDISGNIDIDYLYRGKDKKESISLDSIITATPQTLAD